MVADDILVGGRCGSGPSPASWMANPSLVVDPIALSTVTPPPNEECKLLEVVVTSTGVVQDPVRCSQF
jgi:hypothetical protein